MNKTRVRIAAQDKVLGAIAASANHIDDAEVAQAIKEIGAKLAKQWGVSHPSLPDTRRSAA